MRNLLATAPMLHADETTRPRQPASLAYVHVACTEYLTLMHVGDRSAPSIDAGGVLGQFTGVLVRDGYAGYAHLQAAHAWCGAHLLRDLRSISDADPARPTMGAWRWPTPCSKPTSAAHEARDRGADRLDEATLTADPQPLPRRTRPRQHRQPRANTPSSPTRPAPSSRGSDGSKT